MSSLSQTQAMFESLENRVFLSLTTDLAALSGSSSSSAITSSMLPPATTLTLRNNTATATGTISTASGYGLYSFTASVSGLLTLTGTNTSTTKTMIPKVALYNSAGTELKTVTATSATGSAVVSASVLKGQVFYALISSANGLTGSYKLAIKNTADNAPVISPIAAINSPEGTPITFTVKATDADGDPLTYRMSNLPTGATFDPVTHVFNWTPMVGQSGTYKPTISVSDGIVAKTATVSITVTHTDTVGSWTGACGTIILNSSGAGSTDSWIDTGSDQDMFKVVATKTGTMTLTATNIDATPASNLQLNFYDSAGNALTSATATSASSAATITYGVTAGTTYYVKVLSANSIADPYHLAVSTAAVDQPPVIQAISSVTAQEGTPISFVVSASDPDGDSLTYTASNLPTGATFDASSHTFNWTPAVGQAGSYSPVFTVSDSQLTTSQTADITVTAVPSPSPTPPGDTVGGWSGTAATITLSNSGAGLYDSWIDTGSDQDMFVFVATQTGTLTATVNNTASSPTSQMQINFYDSGLNGALASTAATTPAGTASVQYSVTAGQTYYVKVLSANLTTDPYHLAITTAGTTPTPAPNQAPVMDPIATVSTTVGTPISFTVTASDPNGDALTYSASNLPTGATFNTSTHAFSWTPTAAGTFAPVFTVSDGSLTTSQTASITVTAATVNQPPVMNPITAVSTTVGTPISFTVTASDPNGDALTYSASNLPTGATFNTSTHAFSWTPTAAGTFAPVFTVSDGSLTASQTASITVATSGGGTTGTNDKGNMGAGGTTATYIDQDNDGYGVNAPKGPDADPNDPNVNTYAQALAKYGTVTGILNHLGYSPLRIFYIATNGSNSTGVVNDINHPYADWAGVDSLLKPGDAVIFRAGTYVSGTNANDAVIMADPNYSANGTAANPITVMGMPGEKVVLQANPNTSNRTNGIWYADAYYNFDNFEITGGTYMGSGVKVAYNAAYGTFKDINTHDNMWGVQVNGTWSHLTFDSIVSHDNTAQGGEHGIYLGSGQTDPNTPCDTAVIRNCVIYGNGNTSIGQGIHANGIMTNVTIENNIIHDNGTSGIDLMNGVRNSVIRNNIVYSQPNAQAFIISNYGTGTGYNSPMDNITIINNTLIGTSGWSGRQNVIRVNVDSSSSCNNLVIANNILYMDSVGNTKGPTVVQFDNNLWWNTATIQNNIANNLNNSSFLQVNGTDYTLAQAQGMSSLIKNNLWSSPGFANYAANDFDLLASSPAINLGLTSGAPLLDMRGDSRVGNPDAGAYEYHA